MSWLLDKMINRRDEATFVCMREQRTMSWNVYLGTRIRETSEGKQYARHTHSRHCIPNIPVLYLLSGLLCTFLVLFSFVFLFIAMLFKPASFVLLWRCLSFEGLIASMSIILKWQQSFVWNMCFYFLVNRTFQLW